MEPTFTPLEAKPRSVASSHDYNRLNNDIFYDLLRLYNSASNIDNNTQRLINMLLHDNIFLQRRIAALENKIDNLMEEVRNLPVKRAILLPSSMVASFADYENTKKPLYVEHEYRVVTLPRVTSAISKTHLVDRNTGKGLVPKELIVDVYPFNDSAVNYNVRNAFDGSNSTYFERKVTYTGSVNEEECLLVVTLPQNIVNNLMANSIVIRPFPENSVDIMGIYYNRDVSPKQITFTQENKDTHEEIVAKGWELIPSFPKDNYDQPVPILESSRVKFYFYDIPITMIAVRLRQRNWIEETGERVFIIGAQEIEVLYESYDAAGGYILTPFEPTLPVGVGTYDITRVRHHFANNGALSNLGRYNDSTDTSECLSYEIYEEVVDANGTTLVKLSDLSGIIASRCWIATTLYPDPIYKCTPALDYIEVEYRT